MAVDVLDYSLLLQWTLFVRQQLVLHYKSSYPSSTCSLNIRIGLTGTCVLAYSRTYAASGFRRSNCPV
jgi:hypothetical protein